MRPYTTTGLVAIVIDAYVEASERYQSTIELPWGDEQRVIARERRDMASDTLESLMRARQAAGLCCTLDLARREFPCDGDVGPTDDCSVCVECADREETRAANADARAQAKHF